MTKLELLTIAERNMKKAQRALDTNCNRNGVTEQERNNLKMNVEYSRIVFELIATAL